MAKRLGKIGALLLLLVVLIGPVIQGYDCFNDAPNLDHDAALHTVDALLCISLVACAVGVAVVFLSRKWCYVRSLALKFVRAGLPRLIVRHVIPTPSPPLLLRI